jgi:hypothetical protein
MGETGQVVESESAPPGEWESLDVSPAGRTTPVLGTRARRWVVLALVLVTVTAVAVPWGSQRLKAREYSSLIRCVSRGQAAIAYADSALSGIGKYVGPTLSSTASPSLRRSLLALVSDASGRAEPGVSEARSGCRASSVFYAHHGLAAARSAYLRFLDASADWLQAVSSDGAFAWVAPNLEPLLETARRSLDSAAPSAEARLAVDAALGAN